MSCTLSGSPRPAKNDDGLLARPQLALVGQVLLRELAHLRLDALEVLGHERPLDDEVVEEALVGGRPDAALVPGNSCVTAAASRCAVLCR
jgi:hypothetical protein